MAVMTADVRQTLRNHILSTYLFTADPSALGDDDSFQERRHIDSMGMMQLIQFIESEYQIKLHETDLLPEQLDSVNRLVRLIADKRDGRLAESSVSRAAAVWTTPKDNPEATLTS